MALGHIAFATQGDSRQPSPSVWKDCPNNLLNDLGLGYFVYEQFFNFTGSATAEGTTILGWNLDGDAATVTAERTPADQAHGRIDIETDGDDNDAWIIFQEVGPGFVIDSGLKQWFECRVNLGAAADQGFFAGLAEEAGLDIDLILDDGVSIGPESVFGLQVKSGDTGAVDAVFNLDAGTGTDVATDVSRSQRVTDGGGTVADWPVADVFAKLGMRFNGADQLDYFFDGFLVASLTLVAATHPDGVNMGPCISLKNGDANARSANIDWIRWGYQERT